MQGMVVLILNDVMICYKTSVFLRVSSSRTVDLNFKIELTFTLCAYVYCRVRFG